MPSRSSGDPYGTTDKLAEALLQVMALRLEARGQHPKFRKMLDDYLDAMGIDAAKSVLDMGSGTGVVARAIARRPGFSGRVIGVDLSRYLASAAERLAREEGLADRVEFQVGDTRSLELAGGAFDAVVGHTLLSHVEDPLTDVQEGARVWRAGGTVGLVDRDFASLTFGHADPGKGKAYD